MMGTRARLTVAFSIALTGAVLVVAVPLWIASATQERRALERPANDALAAAERARAILQESIAAGETLTVRPQGASAVSSFLGPILTQAVYARLFSDSTSIFAVFDQMGGQPLFVSRPLAGSLPAQPPQYLTPDRLAFVPPNVRQTAIQGVLSEAAQMRPGAIRTVDWPDGPLILRALEGPGSGVGLIVGAAPGTPATHRVRDIVVTLLLLFPPLAVIAGAIAYRAAGEALRPVERMMNEVEAITDGRSLHKRIAVEPTADEVARLGITLNAMLARLEVSFGALRRFTADASHELKTPITVLRADLERGMSTQAPEIERLAALEEALHETARMADLIDSLLTLARADEGRVDIHRELVELEPLVRDIFETAVILGEGAGLTIRMPVIEPARVMGDPSRLRQLFLNLVTNATKYTPKGGRVELRLSNRLDGVTFSVRDTGIGIAAADLPRVFERFWRADEARSRVATRGGVGLGLAISHWIAQAHGGTITVTSRLGRGTTFTVALPVVPAGTPPAGVGQGDGSAGRG